jgi:hypothetical protein
MEQQYHLKVEALTNELKRLEQDHAVEMTRQPNHRTEEIFKQRTNEL